MPRTVPDRLAEYVDTWAELGVRAWANGWWEMPIEVANEIAPLLGAAAGEIAMVPNVSLGQAAIMSAVDYAAARHRIGMHEPVFRAVLCVSDRLAPRFGAEVVVVPSDDGVGIDEDRLIAAIDERTALVAISHVLFREGFI